MAISLPKSLKTFDDVRRLRNAIQQFIDKNESLEESRQSPEFENIRSVPSSFPVQVQEEGVDIKPRRALNFIGASVTAVDNKPLDRVDLVFQEPFFNGSFLEKFDARVKSDGTIVTMSLEQSGGGDLTLNFSCGRSIFDCTPPATIELIPGTDAIPQTNFIYILESTLLLTKSATGWPSTEHNKIAYFLVPSASLVSTESPQNNFVYINQNWNDFEAGPDGEGHMVHIAEAIRHRGAVYFSGCEGVATQDGNDLWVSVATGVIFQLHRHTFEALDSDTDGGDNAILVVNDPDAAYTHIHSLNEITKHADGVAIGNNKYVTFTLWGVANKTGEVELMMINLPINEYNSADAAATDVQGYTVSTIPREFSLESSTGFLIAAFVCKHTSTAMEIQQTIDLRGQSPVNVSGGGTGGGDVTAAAVIADNAIVRGDGGAKGVQTSIPTIDDSGNIITSANVDGRDLSVDGTKLDGIEASADVTDATNVASAGAVMDSDFSAAEGFMRKTGAGAYTTIKSNLGVSTDPTTNDDSTAGYSDGSLWVNSMNNRTWVCSSASNPATWHLVLSAAIAQALGDLLVGAADNVFGRIAIGSDGDILTATSGSANWAAPVADVTAAANMLDHVLIRGDGAAKGIQDTGILVSDVDAVSLITKLDVDNLQLDGNILSSTDTNGDISLTPNGTGLVNVGNAGDTVFGDGTERDVRPHTTLKSNLGTATKLWNDLYTGGTVVMANLPTSDPSNTGELWNNSGVLTISA